MIVTIDGPCGSGKSTVARELAERLGFEYLDTGAMYRAVTWKATETGVDLEQDTDSIAELAQKVRIDFYDGKNGRRIICDGRDVTTAIRSPEVTRKIKYIADEPEARKPMMNLQRAHAKRVGNIVAEGRDQGSVVFPDAEVKFFLDADIKTRAERRLSDFRSGRLDIEFDEVLEDIRQRDKADRERPLGALRCTDSMIKIDSTGMGVEEVVSEMANIVRQVASSC